MWLGIPFSGISFAGFNKIIIILVINNNNNGNGVVTIHINIHVFFSFFVVTKLEKLGLIRSVIMTSMKPKCDINDVDPALAE